jgi:hypothetical protein
LLINLHTHSIYSDGNNSLEELLIAFKGAGHVCLCVTDHDYCLSLNKFKRQIEEAKELEIKYNFPIICGLEIAIQYEESLVFGTDACLDWMEKLEVVGINIFGVSGEYFLKWVSDCTYEKALVLCHPSLSAQIEGFYDPFDGYEIMNRGCVWPIKFVELMQRIMPKAKPFKNMDLHSLRSWEIERKRVCNEIDTTIKNESDLIHWIKMVNNTHEI